MVVEFGGLARRPADQPDVDVVVGVQARRPAMPFVPDLREQVVVATVEDVCDALVGDAEQVGMRTTAAVVQAIFLVIVLDAFFAVFFERIGWI